MCSPVSYKLPCPDRQELHNYLQTIYRNSNSLEIPAVPVGGGMWRADVLSMFALYGIYILAF